MKMKSTLLGLIAAASLFGVSMAYSQESPITTTTAPAAMAAPSTVNFTATASMPSLRDTSKKDTFTVGLSDAQVSTNFELTCEAGSTSFMFLRKNRACSVSGNGSIINPSNHQALPRTQYVGGYVVQKDGFTDGSTIAVNYLALGKVAPSSEPFSGSLNLKPELTSTGAQALADTVLKKFKSDGSDLIDQRVDTIDLNRLYIPSAGFPSDKGCAWSGNMVFAYQTSSWFMNLNAECDGQQYAFQGNMPWTDSPGVQNQTQYDLTLALASASTAGSASSDDALFASAAGNGDLFASVDGITGQIIMKQSAMVNVKVDGVDTLTPSQVDASGTLTGTNVPLDTVRSLGILFGLLSSNLFGA